MFKPTWTLVAQYLIVGVVASFAWPIAYRYGQKLALDYYGKLDDSI